MARDTGRSALSCRSIEGEWQCQWAGIKEKGWQDLLEEMFSLVKEMKGNVRTSDQRIGKEAGEEQKEVCVSGCREKIDEEQSAFVAQLLRIGRNVGESHEKEKEEQPFPDCQYVEKAEIEGKSRRRDSGRRKIKSQLTKRKARRRKIFENL